MASITIRKLDDEVKQRLRIRAAKAGRSMEEEARLILTHETQKNPSSYLDGSALLARMESLFADEREEIEIPERARAPSVLAE